MSRIRALVRADVEKLDENDVSITMSTIALARDGHVLVPQGCVLDNYRVNPIMLWQHNPDFPVANANDIVINADTITARAHFVQAGVSQKADEVHGLVNGKIIRALSVGFEPIEMEPLDPKRPHGGQRITKWELLECSFVSIPADAGALVTERMLRSALRETEKPEAEMPIPKLETRSMDAQPVAAVSSRHRSLATITPTFTRGLYDVAQLAYLLNSLGYEQSDAAYEAAMEGDGSAVPAMLGDVMISLGEALIAMTKEEVAELMADRLGDMGQTEEDLSPGERAYIAAATNPTVRAFRRAMAAVKLRAGKTISAETERCLRDALTAHDEAMDLHRSAIKSHKAGMKTVQDMLDRCSDRNASESDSSDTSSTETSSDTADDEKRAAEDYRQRQAVLEEVSKRSLPTLG